MISWIKRLWILLVLFLLLGSIGLVLSANRFTETSVKGISVSVSPTPAIFLSPTPSFTPSPTPTPSPVPALIAIQPTIQQKQYGAWYWKAELDRSQMWLGTDTDGKDIWSDSGDLPTQTPTPSPTYSPQSNYSSSISTGSRSSHGISAEIKQRVISIEKKPK